MSRGKAVNGILTSKSKLEAINQRLKQNGVSPQTSDQIKLQELWHILTQTEGDLTTMRQSIGKTHRQHEVKMVESVGRPITIEHGLVTFTDLSLEVERYMEEVRHLSEERDTLTTEFEMENERLKKDLERFQEEKDERKREIAHMLIQEGFTDLADSPPSEAIAYLLVERTRIVDELREAKRKAASSPGSAITTSKQVQEVLDKERKIMEEDMKEEKENIKKAKDRIEQIYAKELERIKADGKLKIANLETQKHRLEQDFRQHQQKARDLEFEVQRLKKSQEREKKERREEVEKLEQRVKESPRDSSSSEPSQHLREARKKLEMELSSAKYRLKTGEEDKTKLNQRVKELTDSLETEKKRRSSYEGTIIKLKTVVDRNKKLISGVEDEKRTLSEEKTALQMRVGFLEKDLQQLKEQQRSLVDQKNSLKSDQTIIEQQGEEIKILREEKQQQALKLQRTMVSLETERRKCLELGEKLTSTEEKWEQIVQRYKHNEKDLNNKLGKLTNDFDLSKSELDANHQRMNRLHQEHNKQLDDARTEAEILKEQLQQEKSLSEQTERHRQTIKELEDIVSDLKKDRDVLGKELQVMIGKEQTHRLQMATTKATAEETRRLEAQLESNVLKQSSLVEELSEEKRKNQKLQDQLNFSQETLKIAEESTDHLKDSIGRKSAELVKQYDWSKESQVKLESKVRTLQRDLEEARSLKQRDKTEIAWRLEREEKRVRELEDMLAEKKEEIAEVRKKTGKASVNQTRAEEKVQEESRLRIDVEQRNKVLEEEMTKQWTQLKDLMTKLSASESAKQELEVQLEKQTNEMRQRYNEIQQVQAETNATTSTLSLVQQRAQAAEHKIPELQQQLDEKSLRLQATEAQLRDLATTKVDLRTSKDDINRLKAQLHEERMEKSLLTQQLDDTKQQLAACLEREERLRHENTDMKHRLMQTQNKLYATEDKSKSVEDMHSLAEQGKKSLLDQVSSLQQEVQRLQSELLQTAQRLDVQIKRHDEQKMHHKNKIQQAREIFSRHKSVLGDSLMKLQQDLNMTNAELQKEQNNRENLQKKHDSLLEEHRKLLAMHSDTEEAVRDQNRNVSTMDYRVKYLERENSVLQDRIDTLSRQRVAMEKLMREYRLEKQKLEIDKSLFASSTPGGYVLPSSPLSTFVPKSTLTSGLGLSQSRNYISTLDTGPASTNGFSTRLSQSGTRTPGFGHSPTNRESLPSPVLSNTLSSDNDND